MHQLDLNNKQSFSLSALFKNTGHQHQHPLPILPTSCYNILIQPKERNSTMFKKKTNGYVIKLSPQGPKMRFKSEKEAQEYLAKLKEKNNKYRN